MGAQTTSNELFEVIRYKELLRNLIARDIKVRYKRSVLGFVWVMLNPLLMMLILTIVFSGLFKVSTGNYTVYLLSGIILWNFFAQSTTTSLLSFLGNGNLIKKIYLPKSIFPLSVILSALIHFLFSLIPFFIVFAITGVSFGPHFYILPVVIVLAVLFAFGISLIISTLTVFFHDTRYIYDVLLMVWMYMTPIFYPESIIPVKFSFILNLNPFYYFLSVFRAALYADVSSLPQKLLGAFLFSIASVAAGWSIYSKYKSRIVYYL